MTVTYVDSLKRARANAVTAVAGATAVLEITNSGGTILVSFALNNPIAGGATADGILTLSGLPKSANVIGAGGTASLAQIKTATGGSLVVSGLTVGTGTEDIVLAQTNLPSGYSVVLDDSAEPPVGETATFPFGLRLDGTYPYGIKPNQTNSAMDATISAYYVLWKAARLRAAPAFTPMYGVHAGQSITDAYYVDAAGASGGVVVSEGIGYGMLLTVIMAGFDAEAKTYFDGLLRLSRCFPAYGMIYNGSGPETYLMDFRLNWNNANEDYLVHSGGGWNAADGDMDMALALLMADRQWGSAGSVDYLQEGLNVIAALKAANFHATYNIMYVSPQDDPTYKHDASRTSDYMPGHFRSYKAATGDTFWDTSRTNSYELMLHIINQYSASARMTPGWIWQPITYFVPPDLAQPSTGNVMGEGGNEGVYDQNATRNPWRWATDYVWTGDSTWGTLASNITNTIKTTAGGNPNSLWWIYNLDGTVHEPGGGTYYDQMQASMTMVGGMANASHQAWVNAVWTKMATTPFQTGYYNAELSLLGMIVASGNWWRP